MATIEIAQFQNGKLTRLYLGDIVIWFSYETPVAYRVPGIAGVIVSDKGWSQTTRRHLGFIDGKRAPIPHEDFERGLTAIQDGTAQALGSESAIIRTIAKLVEQADAARGERVAAISRGLDSTSLWSA